MRDQKFTENKFMERIGEIKRRDEKLYNNLSPQVRASYQAYTKQKAGREKVNTHA